MIQMNSQSRNRLKDFENELMVAGGKQGVWEGHVHTAIFKMDSQQGLMYGTGNSVQSYVAVWMGEGFEGEWIHAYVCMAESLCCSLETLTQHLLIG